MADIEQAVVIRVKSDGTTEVSKLADELEKLGGKAKGAGGAIASAFDEAAREYERFRIQVEAVTGTQAELTRQTAILARAFEDLTERGLSQFQIGKTLGPQFEMVSSLAAKMGVSMQSLGPSVAGAGTAVRSLGTATAVATPALVGMSGQLGNLRTAFTAAGGGASGLMSAVGGLRGLAGILLPITAGVIGLGAAFVLLKEGIKNAEAMNDLDRSMKAVSSSAASAAEAMAFLEKASKQTRNTGDELIAVFVQLWPMLKGVGFTEGGALQEVVKLSQAATALTLSLDTVIDSYRRLAAGQTGRNQLAMALGITPDELTKSADALGMVDKKMADIIASAGAAGQTTESAGKKIKDAWLDAFSNGIRGATDLEGHLQSITDKLTDPKLLESIEAIGGAMSWLLDRLVVVVKSFQDLATNLGKIDDFIGKYRDLLIKYGANYGQTPAPTGPSGAGGGGGWGGEAGAPPRVDPKAQEAAIAAANELAAALAKVQGQAIASRQAIDALLRGLADDRVEIDVAFKPPETDPIKKAIQEVDNIAKGFLKSYAEQEIQLTNQIEAGLQKVKELQASITAMRSADKPNDAQIAAAQQSVAIVLQEVTAYRQARDTVRELTAHVIETGTAARKVAEENALAKMAEETRKKFLEIAVAVDGDLKSALEGLKDLPIEVGGPARDATLELFADYAAQVRNAIEAGFSEADLSIVLAQLAKTFGDGAKAIGEGGKQAAAAIKTAAETFLQNREQLSGAFADVFTSLAVNGGEQFGQIASAMFVDGVRNGAKKLTDIFSGAVLTAFGAGQVDAEKFKLPDGGFDQAGFDAANLQADVQQKAIVQAIQAGLGAIGQTVDMFKNAAKGQQTSVLGSTLSYAAIGASIGTAIAPGIGTIIGAIVGALVGGILASIANAKAKKELPFAQYGIEDGQAFLEPYPGRGENFSKVSAKQRADMLQRMESELQATETAYINLLLKFPAKIFAALPAFTAGLDIKNPIKGDIDSVDFLRSFNENFELFVTDTLPKAVAAAFKAPVQAAFEAMGVTTDQFNEVWNHLQGMDPKKALEVLNDFADAVIGFVDAWEKMRQIVAETTSRGQDISGLNLTTDGTQRAPGVNDFMQNLAESEKGILNLAQAFAALPFEEQVKQAKAMGAALNEVLDGLIAYLNEIAQIEKSIAQDVMDRKLTVNLEQAGGDKNLQSEILKNEYQRIVEQLGNAAKLGLNPAEVEDLYRRAADIANRAFQLDPTKEAAAKYFQQLDYLAALANQQLTTMANQAQNEVNALLAMVKPFADYIAGLPADFEPAFAAANRALVDFSAALDLLAARIASDDLLAPEPWNTPHPSDPNNPDNPGNPHFPDEPPPLPPPAYDVANAPSTYFGGSQEILVEFQRQNDLLERIAVAAEKGDASEATLRAVLGAANNMRMDPSEMVVNVVAPRMPVQSNARRAIEGERYRRVVTRT